MLVKSRKGAALLYDEAQDRVAWVRPRALREDGTLTKGGSTAIAEGKTLADYLESKSAVPSNKKACYKVKVDRVKARTDSAMLIRCFDGSEAWIPFSQIHANTYAEKSDGYYIECWIVEKKGLQHKSKKVWIDV